MSSGREDAGGCYDAVCIIIERPHPFSRRPSGKEKKVRLRGTGEGKAMPPYQPLQWEFFLPFHGTGVLKGHEHIQGQTAKEKLVPRSLHVPSREECKPESLTSASPSLLLISSTLRPQPMSLLLGDPRDPYQSTCVGQLLHALPSRSGACVVTDTSCWLTVDLEASLLQEQVAADLLTLE